MTIHFAGPRISFPASLRHTDQAALQAAVAHAAYASAYDALKTIERGMADTLGFYGMVCAAALLNEDECIAAARRVAAYPYFHRIDEALERGLPFLAEQYREKLLQAGWNESQGQAALKGMAIALLALAHQVQFAPTIHHVDPSPPLQSVGFPRLIDRLIFGLNVTTSTTIANPDCSTTNATASNHNTECSISAVIEDWLTARNLSTSERSRHGSSARLFMIAAGLSGDDPATALERIGADTARMYVRLSDATGSKWGTVAPSYAGKSAQYIIEAATTPPIPTWAQHPLKPRGRKLRLAHIDDLLTFVRDRGMSVPRFDWDAATDGIDV